MCDKDTIPLNFALSINPALTWRQVIWGYHYGILGWKCLLNFANYRLSWEYNDVESDILLLGKQNIEEIVEKAELLASKEKDADDLKQFWMLVLLAWYYKHNSGFDDALDKAASVYEDFGCPGNIEEFVRYAPVKDEYNPLEHTLEENLHRMMGKWESYLVQNGIDLEKI